MCVVLPLGADSEVFRNDGPGSCVRKERFAPRAEDDGLLSATVSTGPGKLVLPHNGGTEESEKGTQMSPEAKHRARSATPPFTALYFGKSDSRNELEDERGDFLKSFVNIGHVVDEVMNGNKTLVLGPKGTGKSALAWYLYGSQSGEADHLASVKDASELPLADIPQLETGQPAGAERTVSAWRFILLCNYLDLLLKDESAIIPNASEVARVTRLLRRYGFMGSGSGRALIDVSKTKVSIPIPRVGTIYERESQKELTIFALLPYLENWASNTRSGNRHLLLLDGLDSIFLNDRKYDESLAALVQAAYSINQKLRSNGATGSVVLLLRNDVFNRVSLTLPDSQKMRDDFAIELDWRVLSGAQGVRAPLLRLVNDKSAHALDLESLQVLDYFPSSVQLGSRNPNKEPRFMPTLQYLLNLTRHTPRDLLRLLEEIRLVEASGNFPASGKVLRQDVIREGTIQYANRYFVGAIRNEFAGYDDGPEEAEAALASLQALRRQKFRRDDFRAKLTELTGSGAKADRLLKLLFYAGAIGNVVKVNGAGSYLQFYHRRDDASIYLRGQLIVHGALCHAWNIPFSV